MKTVTTDDERILGTVLEHSAVAAHELPGVREAVLAALVYADLFDYPLTEEQVARYQVGTEFSRTEVTEALASAAIDGQVSFSGDYYSLTGREALFDTRKEREGVSGRIWRRARRRARWIARSPFVRMVAVTGALSMDNIAGKPDIDLLVVTEPGRVWICRRFLILKVRLARLVGDDLCPNYILASSYLELDQRDFFTAHELAQMVPLYGLSIYGEMLKQNRWAACYLPAAFPAAKKSVTRQPAMRPPRFLERVLRIRPFDAWEKWELRRLRQKLSPLIGEAAEVVCSPEQCKGHTGLHRSSVLARFRERLRQAEIDGAISLLLNDDSSGGERN